MRKFLRSFTVLAFAVMLGVVSAGCSLFQQNLDHDYNRIVASMQYDGDTVIKITKKELLDTYNSYGYQFVQNYGNTVEEAYQKTIDALIDREVTIQIAVEQFDPKRKHKKGVLGMLSEYEAATARKNAFTSLNTALNQYIDEIKGTEPASGDETPAGDDTAVKYTPYTKTVIVSENSNGEREFMPDLESYRNVADVSTVPAEWSPELPPNTSSAVFTKALARIIRNLESREKGFEDLITRDNRNDKNHKGQTWGWFVNTGNSLLKNLTADDVEALNREILRMVQSNEKSTLVNRLSAMFTLGLEGETGFDIYLNRGNDQGSKDGLSGWQEFENAVKTAGVAAVSANGAAEAYKNNVRQAIVNYNHTPPADMEADLVATGEGKGLTGVYYVPAGIAEKLFTVSHILVGFTEAQTARYKELTAATADSASNNEAELLKLYAATKSADGKNIYEVFNDVKSSVDNAGSLQEKYETFRDKIYEYNTDPGMQNPEFEYVMTTTVGKNGMVQPFTDASLELKKDGIKGAVSGIVWAEYGAHIIMYTRDISDFIYTASDELINGAYEKTLFAPQTAYGNKTPFDTLLGTASYDNYEKALLKQHKAGKTVEVYKNIYENLYK